MQHSDPCALSALEPFFCDFSAARPRFVARLARAIALSREGLARVRIRVKLRMTKGVVFFFPYRTASRSGLTYIILGATRTYLQY